MRKTRRADVLPKGRTAGTRAADRTGDRSGGAIPPFPPESEQRAVLFIDGNNWYFALKEIGVRSSALDYRRVARKLVQERELRQVRYYVGRVRQPLPQFRAQQSFLATVQEQGVSVFLGKSGPRRENARANEARNSLLRAFESRESEIPRDLMRLLREYCTAHPALPEFVEKQVDAMISADLVELAYRDEYEVAYLLSADSDFVPPVRAARRQGRRVFVVNPRPGHELRQAATEYLTITPDWFEDLYL